MDKVFTPSARAAAGVPDDTARAEDGSPLVGTAPGASAEEIAAETAARVRIAEGITP